MVLFLHLCLVGPGSCSGLRQIFIVQWLLPSYLDSSPKQALAPAISIYLRVLWHVKLFLDSLPKHMQFPLLWMTSPHFFISTIHTYLPKLSCRATSSQKSFPLPRASLLEGRYQILACLFPASSTGSGHILVLNKHLEKVNEWTNEILLLLFFHWNDFMKSLISTLLMLG